MEITKELRKIRSSSVSPPKFGKKRRGLQTLKTNRCICMPLQRSPVEFTPVWEELRLNGQLCDGLVRCEDGTEFRIHRAILSAVSPYFKALFTNSITRDQTDTTEANVSVCSNIFKILLKFAYTGECFIDDSNVENLLMYADQYEIIDVIHLCCKYLMDQLCPSNCIGILKFANQYFCKELENRGSLYLKHHFPEFLHDSLEFVYLTIDEIVNLFKDDVLNIKSEETLFEAIQKWVEFDFENRKRHLLDLLRCIRIGNLSYECVNSIKTWPIVGNDEDCCKFLSSTLDYIESVNNEALDVTVEPLFRPRIPYDILFAVGGWSAGAPTNFVETYDNRADCWLISPDTDTNPRAYHGLCALGGLVYMIGGFDGNDYFNTVRCFDPETHQWQERACMYYHRCYVSVVIHQEKIYALGGYNGRIRMKTAERYDSEKNQWELIPPMQKQRSDASAAVLKDKIYVVGGFDGQEVMNSMEMFDISISQWSTIIANMTTARSGVSLIAFKSSLYALGGFNGNTRLISGERYTPGCSACWIDIADMMTPRSNFATVLLDDYIYVIGGFDGSTTINYVEYYDPEEDEWFDASSMNLNRSALGACVISGLPNAIEYSVLGHSQREEDQSSAQQSSQLSSKPGNLQVNHASLVM